MTSPMVRRLFQKPVRALSGMAGANTTDDDIVIRQSDWPASDSASAACTDNQSECRCLARVINPRVQQSRAPLRRSTSCNLRSSSHLLRQLPEHSWRSLLAIRVEHRCQMRSAGSRFASLSAVPIKRPQEPPAAGESFGCCDLISLDRIVVRKNEVRAHRTWAGYEDGKPVGPLNPNPLLIANKQPRGKAHRLAVQWRRRKRSRFWLV